MSEPVFTIPPKGVIIKQWPAFIDNLGCLMPVEFKDLPFVPIRAFTVKNVPAGYERGGHAHRETRQYLFCIKGLILVILHDGKEHHEFKLVSGQGVLVEKLTWDSQKFMTGDDVLWVFCSTEFSSQDYIRNFDEFKKLVNEKPE